MEEELPVTIEISGRATAGAVAVSGTAERATVTFTTSGRGVEALAGPVLGCGEADHRS